VLKRVLAAGYLQFVAGLLACLMPIGNWPGQDT